MSDFDTDMDDAYLDAPIAPSQYHSHDTELLLERLRDMIDSAPNVPLSSTPRISRAVSYTHLTLPTNREV